MRTIVVVNGKGGVGKSTLSVLIALSLGRAQIPVAVRDLDKRQQSTAEWTQRLSEVESGLVEENATVGPKPRFVLVDTPGNMEFVESAELPKANLYIVPTSTSLLDQKVTRDTVAYLKKKFPEAAIRVLFNKVAASAKDSRALDEFAIAIGAEALKNFLRQRTCYRYAAIDGWSELSKEAEEELLKITTEIASIA